MTDLYKTTGLGSGTFLASGRSVDGGGAGWPTDKYGNQLTNEQIEQRKALAPPNKKETSMTDRELLEYAAKAAGYTDIKYEDGWWLEVRYGITKAVWNGEDYWNPLEDDGDAFRLAVKLSLEIDIHFTGIAIRTPNGIKILISAEEINDPYAATRRAIVETAAEIGKEMK